MPRTFTVNFMHNNRPYMAVVSHLQSSVCVYIPDESLHHIIPNGRFTYDTEQGVNVGNSGSNPLDNLMLDVLAAVELQPKVSRADTM